MTEIQSTNIAVCNWLKPQLEQAIAHDQNLEIKLSGGQCGSLHHVLKASDDKGLVELLNKRSGTGVLVNWSVIQCLDIFHHVQAYLVGLDAKVVKSLGEVA